VATSYSDPVNHLDRPTWSFILFALQRVSINSRASPPISPLTTHSEQLDCDGDKVSEINKVATYDGLLQQVVVQSGSGISYRCQPQRFAIAMKTIRNAQFVVQNSTL